LNDDGKIIIKNEEAVNNLKEIIDCYKDFFDKYEKDGFKYKDYDFVFKPSEEYTTLNDFFNEVEQQGYKVDFTPINKQKLDSLVKAGQFYLFKINCNKKKIQRNYWKETIKEKSSMQLN
jgi:CRISPR-associated protein Cpf1